MIDKDSSTTFFFTRYWLEIEDRGFVVGYSSSEMTSESIVFRKDALPDDFETRFSFYRLDSDLNLIYDESRVNELIKEKEEYDKLPTDKEKIESLEAENSELQDRVTFTEDALMDLILTKGVEI